MLKFFRLLAYFSCDLAGFDASLCHHVFQFLGRLIAQFQAFLLDLAAVFFPDCGASISIVVAPTRPPTNSPAKKVPT